MTYPPGGPGYPTTQPPSQYAAPTQQFERPTDPGSPVPVGPSKLPFYLGGAVAVLGLAVYLTSFGPLFGGGGRDVGIFLVITPLVAGLLAGVGLLPKQDSRSGVTAALAVLGFLLLVFVVINGAPVGWAFYPYIVFSVLQAAAAVWQLLLDAGVVTAPTPRPKSEPAAYGPYGQPPQYYGQPSYGGPGGPGGPSQQQPNYQPQYGGYQGGAQGTGGFPALSRPTGPPNGPQNGPPTPPTGFPAFGQPQAAQSSGPPVEQQQAHVTSQQPSQQSAPPPS